MAITSKRSRWSAMASTSSSLSIQIPRSLRWLKRSACASHRDMGTRTFSPVTEAFSRSSGLGITTQLSSTIWPFLMSLGINALLERFNTDTPIGINEKLAFDAAFHIDAQNLFKYIRHFFPCEGRAKDVSQSCLVAGRAAQGNLVPFLALLIHTQNTDITHVVMATSVHATRNIQV